eukprot:SAG31_NODE_4745_length_2985_cov_2.095634_1_plen_216_part_00
MGWHNGPGTSNCQTIPRELTYDSVKQKLLSLPAAEITSLRTGIISKHSAVHVAIEHPLSLVNGGTTSFDLEFVVELPQVASNSSWFGLSILASPSATTKAAVLLSFNVSASATASNRAVIMSLGVPDQPRRSALNTTVAFELPVGSAAMEVRVLVDRSIVEIFAGGGRGVISVPVLSPGKDPAATEVLLNSQAAAGVDLGSSCAWAMGCGWARYP